MNNPHAQIRSLPTEGALAAPDYYPVVLMRTDW